MNSFNARATLRVGQREYEIYRLDALDKQGTSVRRLPYCLRILLENLLRTEGGGSVTADDIRFLASWNAKEPPSKEIAFTPARVLMQDFTGVPAIVDLAAMRDAMTDLQGNPALINPLQPAELVIDHSVQVDAYGTPQAYPDTLVGTDSHTTMINGRGVLGWGVGGIEAEAAMLGQPVSMLLPNVI